jgi:hypothetical protein
MKKKNKLLGVLVILSSSCYAQMNEFAYRKEILSVKNVWHKIILPPEVLGKVRGDLSDLRIYGFNGESDTVEVPYILKLTKEKLEKSNVSFDLINTSHNGNGYFYTFALDRQVTINQILLDFQRNNFDYRVNLEGSQDLNTWFTIVEAERVLSIHEGEMDFEYTDLNFPNSSYRYFRLCVESIGNPGLNTADLSMNEVTQGKYTEYGVKSLRTETLKAEKQSIVYFDLISKVPVSRFTVKAKSDFDYYRPVTLQYLADSIKTETGWVYNWINMGMGTLNSINKNAFHFESTLASKFKLIIENDDNAPLAIEKVVVEGYEHELLVRFTKNQHFFLCYGSLTAGAPSYDIEHFTDKIPVQMSALKLGEEVGVEATVIPVKDTLFKNKTVLWVIMGAVILLLGGFTVNMMRQKS